LPAACHATGGYRKPIARADIHEQVFVPERIFVRQKMQKAEVFGIRGSAWRPAAVPSIRFPVVLYWETASTLPIFPHAKGASHVA